MLETDNIHVFHSQFHHHFNDRLCLFCIQVRTTSAGFTNSTHSPILLLTHFLYRSKSIQILHPHFFMTLPPTPFPFYFLLLSLSNSLSYTNTLTAYFLLYTNMPACIFCHGPCSVMFFPKNNQRTAPTESPMMATSPSFSATLTIGHPRWNYIGPPSDFIPYSNTTNKSAFLSLPLPTSTMRYSTAAQPELHHAPHTFHVSGQSYCARTSSQGHGFRSPQGLARI